MKTPFLAGALALAMLSPSIAMARSDCHRDMKDLLEGTLDMAKHVDVSQEEDDDSQGCTIADRGEGSPSPRTLSKVPSPALVLASFEKADRS